MSVMESVANGVAVSVLAGLTFSKAKDIFFNEDFKSALKYFADNSNPLPKRAEAYLKVIEIVLDSTLSSTKYNRKIIIYLNASLVSAISKAYDNIENSSPEQKKSNTIVGMMLQEKLRKASKSQIILIFCLLLNFALSTLSLVNFSYFLFLLVSLSLFAFHAEQKLIDYRIRKGWYGKNEFEAKEIINFIILHAQQDDFNSSGGLKRVIPLPDVEIKERQSSGVLGEAL